MNWLRHDDHHSPRYRAEVKNEWSYISLVPVCPHGVDRENLSFVIGAIPLCCGITKMVVQSKHNTVFNNMKFATRFGYK